MALPLEDYQIEAVEKLDNGKILVGDVGSGKSRTALVYYYISCGGQIRINKQGEDKPMSNPKQLYIITTAMKRDSEEWLSECTPFGKLRDEVIVDSWNNIKKYRKVFDAFFIFDEQRVVGRGVWVKSFLDIARKNSWILLSATPGDTWSDYIPVFIANGFYKNRTEFLREHAIYNRYAKFPKIDRYIGESKLNKYRKDIIVVMRDNRPAKQHHINVTVGYNKDLYSTVFKDRWDPYDNCPIKETGKLCYLLRRTVNSNAERLEHVNGILKEKHRAIIFYNYDYELDMLKEFLDNLEYVYGEWNGSKHEHIESFTDDPYNDDWVYLVQYAAGAEGWNCIYTDCIIFYSNNYSYRIMKQSAGRIDRMNTSFKDLYYYHFTSTSPIDIAIQRALAKKKSFNERAFLTL